MLAGPFPGLACLNFNQIEIGLRFIDLRETARGGPGPAGAALRDCAMAFAAVHKGSFQAPFGFRPGPGKAAAGQGLRRRTAGGNHHSSRLATRVPRLTAPSRMRYTVPASTYLSTVSNQPWP